MEDIRTRGNLGRSLLCAGIAGIALAVPAAARAQDSAVSEERVKQLEAQIESLKTQLDEIKKALPKATPTWRGAPQFDDKERGLSFKVRGRIFYDVGNVEDPGPTPIAISPTQDLGFNTRFRRIRIGVEGALGAGFAYKAEVDYSNNQVGIADAFIDYRNGPLWLRVGHMETLPSLEQMTSTRNTMFIERAQMNEAYGHARRLGGTIAYDKDELLIRAGLFNDTVNADLNNDEWLGAARIVWAPKFDGNQLHFGVNFQHREFSDTALNFRYRARPLLQTTGTRFVDTGPIAARGDDTYGVEAAGIFGPLHLVGEVQFASVDAFGPGKVFAVGETPGTTSRLDGDPTFVSYYGEIGYWFTGETRGYKKGEFERTRVKRPVGDGGAGAFGMNLRYDVLDLSDKLLRTGGVGTAASRGGKQTGYLASLVWQPIDYIRVTAQYAHAAIEGGPFAAIVKPLSTDPVNERRYGVDTFAMRFAVDW